MTAFDEQICKPVREHLERPVRLPRVGMWQVHEDRGDPVLHLMLDASDLSRNLQEDRAAAPYFLMAFAWWYGRITDTEPRLHLQVTGRPPRRTNAQHHVNRSWIVLDALQAALGERLTVEGAPDKRWPDEPVLNAPTQSRSTSAGPQTGPEHQAEVALTAEPALAAAFSELVSPISEFRRQLPLGVFDGTVSHRSRWTPGGGAQADLWATSPDGSHFHLFELKVRDNVPLGVLPELLGYLWILQCARVGLSDGRPVTGGGDGADAARAAQRLSGWIVAPEVHPLLLKDGASPLSWIAEGLSEHVDLGIVRYEDGGDRSRFAGWGDIAWRSG